MTSRARPYTCTSSSIPILRFGTQSSLTLVLPTTGPSAVTFLASPIHPKQLPTAHCRQTNFADMSQSTLEGRCNCGAIVVRLPRPENSSLCREREVVHDLDRVPRIYVYTLAEYIYITPAALEPEADGERRNTSAKFRAELTLFDRLYELSTKYWSAVRRPSFAARIHPLPSFLPHLPRPCACSLTYLLLHHSRREPPPSIGLGLVRHSYHQQKRSYF